jgi:hypothetical protein
LLLAEAHAGIEKPVLAVGGYTLAQLLDVRREWVVRAVDVHALGWDAAAALRIVAAVGGIAQQRVPGGARSSSTLVARHTGSSGGGAFALLALLRNTNTAEALVRVGTACAVWLGCRDTKCYAPSGFLTCGIRYALPVQLLVLAAARVRVALAAGAVDGLAGRSRAIPRSVAPVTLALKAVATGLAAGAEDVVAERWALPWRAVVAAVVVVEVVTIVTLLSRIDNTVTAGW